MFLQHGKSKVKNYVFITVGTALMALAINSIYDPMKLVTGGFSGLAIVIKTVTEPIVTGGIPLWLTNAILNVPLFFIGIKITGPAPSCQIPLGNGQLICVALYFACLSFDFR